MLQGSQKPAKSISKRFFCCQSKQSPKAELFHCAHVFSEHHWPACTKLMRYGYCMHFHGQTLSIQPVPGKQAAHGARSVQAI